MWKAQRNAEEFLGQVEASGGRVDFVFGDDRPFAQCHASTVVETRDGLLCAWFGGTREKAADVGIWLSRFADGHWSAPTRVAKVEETAHWNPVLFRDPDRGVFLFFKAGPRIAAWRTFWMVSEDGGQTWSVPEELVPGDEGGRGPVKNKPIILSDGAWLAPASTEYEGWRPFVDRSEDGGRTWERSEYFEISPDIIPGKGAIQPALWEHPEGHVHALMRTSGGCVGRADSDDGGRTWTAVRRTDIPNNNSGVDALHLGSGRLALVFNPVEEDWGERTPLSLGLSEDNGETWRVLAHLESGPGEYSYPAIVETRNGVAISYTWRRERVRCWQVPAECLLSE